MGNQHACIAHTNTHSILANASCIPFWFFHLHSDCNPEHTLSRTRFEGISSTIQITYKMQPVERSTENDTSRRKSKATAANNGQITKYRDNHLFFMGPSGAHSAEFYPSIFFVNEQERHIIYTMLGRRLWRQISRACYRPLAIVIIAVVADRLLFDFPFSSVSQTIIKIIVWVSSKTIGNGAYWSRMHTINTIFKFKRG